MKGHSTVDHDYVVAVDGFGLSYPWPSVAALARAGGFDQHLAHMRSFWNAELAAITQLQLPDAQLVDAYRSGFIYTQIARSGDHLNTGVNNYQSEFSHDVVGMLANLFTQGDFADARALLVDARDVVGSPLQYEDGVWTYAWPWAVYLLKTGDIGFVRANFSTEGPAGASEPSIEDSAHRIASDRTGPGGIMRETDDIDSNGLWTVDDYEALMGLAAYRYLAQRLGDATETAWATGQYDSLLAATNSTLDATINRYHLDYLPCSMVQPNSANRCHNPEDANWAAPLARRRGPGTDRSSGPRSRAPASIIIDATYAYGFARLAGKLPANTVGGYPVAYYYSPGYNAGYGSWGLASEDHRDQGILELRVHDRPFPERALFVVGELQRPRTGLTVGRKPSRRWPRILSPCLGHRQCQQGAPGLPRRGTIRRLARRRPRCPRRLAAQRHDLGGVELPHHRRSAVGLHHLGPRWQSSRSPSTVADPRARCCSSFRPS